MKKQIGWFDPANKRLCHVDEKKARPGHHEACVVPAWIDSTGVRMLDAEDKLLTIALAETNGSRTEAAKLLGIPIRTLHHRIKKRTDQNE